MNEETVRKIVKLKFDAAEKIIDSLPPDVSEKIIVFAKLVLDSIEENVRESDGRSKKETVSPGKLNNVVIE